MPKGSLDEQRIATLNIRHGGTKHATALTARLLDYGADVLVVTEFRPNRSGELLMERLQSEGYFLSHPGGDARRNAVLVASRSTIAWERALDDSLDAERLWCVQTGGIVLCGVLFPQRDAKQPYWKAVIDAARRSGVDLFIGDFNTGNNALDKDPKGAPFINSDMPRRLIDSGYVDLWRIRHPRVREYSWYSQTRNGFRLDHAFAASALAARVTECEFDHEPRLLGETDHSALVVIGDLMKPSNITEPSIAVKPPMSLSHKSSESTKQFEELSVATKFRAETVEIATRAGWRVTTLADGDQFMRDGVTIEVEITEKDFIRSLTKHGPNNGYEHFPRQTTGKIDLLRRWLTGNQSNVIKSSVKRAAGVDW